MLQKVAEVNNFFQLKNKTSVYNLKNCALKMYPMVEGWHLYNDCIIIFFRKISLATLSRWGHLCRSLALGFLSFLFVWFVKVTDKLFTLKKSLSIYNISFSENKACMTKKVSF